MMNNIQLVSIEKLEKGKRRLRFDTGEGCIVYASEIRGLNLEAGVLVPQADYEHIFSDIVGKRAKKRALHLLEQMDRTEQQLRDKLALSEYPERCIEEAIAYVKGFHYLDDERYAQTFTRYKQTQMSRQQIKQKLMQKGVAKDIAAKAIEEEYDMDEMVHIRQILAKKQFSADATNEAEFRRVYHYLLRRGFRSNDILKEMKCVGADW